VSVFELVMLDPSPAGVARGAIAISDFPSFFTRAFGAVAAAVTGQGLEIVGEPFAFFPSAPGDFPGAPGDLPGAPGDLVEVAAGFPVSGLAEPTGDVVPWELPGGRAVTTVHVGPYDSMETVYDQMRQWINGQGLIPADHLWEVYLSDPSDEPDPSTWRTQIVWPVGD
jgi:hypothetical protein